MSRPPQRVLVRLRRPLLLGGRWWPIGAELRLPADMACTLWGKSRVELLQHIDLRRMTL